MWLQLVYRCLPSLSEHCNYMRSQGHMAANDFARVRSVSTSKSSSFDSPEGREVDARLSVSCRVTSLDHLVGAGKQSRRHREAKRPSSLEVDE
jgi:hypothetical protein